MDTEHRFHPAAEFNSDAAFKPEHEGTPEEEPVFDFKAYFRNLTEKVMSIRRGDPANGIVPDPQGALQYLHQEKIKAGWRVACELRRKHENEVRGAQHALHLHHLVEGYTARLKGEKPTFLGKIEFEGADEIPEPDYSVFEERSPEHPLEEKSPVYPYEADLDLTTEKKKEMMQKVVRYLRERNIFVQFARTINDAMANDTKGAYIELHPDGDRDLPIGELMGNRIILNPWNVDFMGIFLTIGHLYGHVVQESDIKEYEGIRKFLTYEKPLDMDRVQSEYQLEFGGTDYRADFKTFEEEAFGYAKFTFQEAGIEWNDKLEHAMRTYIDADYDELWDWSTKLPEKNAQSFMDRFQEYYKRPSVSPLKAKPIDIRVVSDPNNNVKVLRDGRV